MAARKRTGRPVGDESAAPSTEQADEQSTESVAPDVDQAADERPVKRHRPVWMVPTPDGMVPEHELRGR